jgi:hypothetical protein
MHCTLSTISLQLSIANYSGWGDAGRRVGVPYLPHPPLSGQVSEAVSPVRAVVCGGSTTQPRFSLHDLLWGPGNLTKVGPGATIRQAQGPKMGFHVGGTPILQKRLKIMKHDLVQNVHTSGTPGPCCPNGMPMRHPETTPMTKHGFRLGGAPALQKRHNLMKNNRF